MRNEQQRGARVEHAADAPKGFTGETQIAHRQRFVNQKYLRVHRAEQRKRQTNQHAGRIELDRAIEVLAQLGEAGNLRGARFGVSAWKTKQPGALDNVLAAGELR